MESATKPQVLVVDDRPVIADSLASILNISGFLAVAAYSGEQALELASTQRFDHLISDVVMPGMNGIELAIAFSSCLPECRILLISGNNDTARILSEAQRRGYDFDLLAKPVHPLFLIDKLRNASVPTQTN